MEENDPITNMKKILSSADIVYSNEDYPSATIPTPRHYSEQ